ncbi:LpxI family protein [Caulobacter sp. S45]|uniref:UDP-2,3-diacylglucosamine diphosphatase n=1 Tax=Caulobacter sp. S45 TaxID=1641861 RepID=UPI00131A7807|nr:UDP-2,3-diacylglucosamine diphosphatase LpxI [Caulobacter sp. S45]
MASRKLGLIVGGGELPQALADACIAAGRPLFVVRLRGFADAGTSRFPSAEIGIAELGHILEALKREGCEAVCFAGEVKRPDFSALKPDLRGMRSLAGVIAAARKGDDALLRFLMLEFEREGFVVEGAEQVHAGLTLGSGPLGAWSPRPEDDADMHHAIEVVRTLGRLDIGQAAVVVDGLVLAVEAQEGTDAMLTRCAALPANVLGSDGARRGVLVKWPKPIQERRVDLPTIGVRTLEGAAAAGLAGVVGEARGVLVLDREAVIAAADRLGLFVTGL